jgi:hypothetical protein
MTAFKQIFGAVAIAGLLYPAGAFAQNAMTPSQMSEVQGATTGLGTSHRFHSVDAAMQHCPGDTIVWASGTKLTYKMPSAPGYGVSGHGFYACKMEADGAGFQREN